MYRIRTSCMFSLILLLLLFAEPLPVSAEDNPCDPEIEQSTTDQLGYRLRGDRCEGRYIQEVGSTILSAVSLTEAFEEYDLNSGEDLVVEWNAPPGQNIRLRAHGLRQRLYYRMDTTAPSGNTSYRWPIKVLSGLDIPRVDVGVLGWMTYSIGKARQDVFLPLRISQQGSATPSQRYQMILWPGKELTEVYISLAPVKADGSFGSFIMDGKALEYSYYPAEQGIELEISAMETPGVYYLEIGAELKRGGTVTIEHWLYHAG